jgi:hypothetical protein
MTSRQDWRQYSRRAIGQRLYASPRNTLVACHLLLATLYKLLAAAYTCTMNCTRKYVQIFLLPSIPGFRRSQFTCWPPSMVHIQVSLTLSYPPTFRAHLDPKSPPPGFFHPITDGAGGVHTFHQATGSRSSSH